MRAGTAMSWARIVAVVALAWNLEARVPAARVRLNAMALGTLVAGDAHRRRRATDPGDLTTQPPGATKDPKWKTRTDRQPIHARTQNHTQEAPSDTTRKPTGGSRLNLSTLPLVWGR